MGRYNVGFTPGATKAHGGPENQDTLERFEKHNITHKRFLRFDKTEKNLK